MHGLHGNMGPHTVHAPPGHPVPCCNEIDRFIDIRERTPHPPAVPLARLTKLQADHTASARRLSWESRNLYDTRFLLFALLVTCLHVDHHHSTMSSSEVNPLPSMAMSR